GSRSTPDRQKDVLDDLLSRGTVQGADGQVKNQPGIAAVERPEGFLGSGGELAHQLLVAAIRVGWHRARSVVHCSLLHDDSPVDRTERARRRVLVCTTQAIGRLSANTPSPAVWIGFGAD